MHGGLIGHARQSIQQARYAKPWQQALLCAVLIAVGVALTVTGERRGCVRRASLFSDERVASLLRSATRTGCRYVGTDVRRFRQ
jgi:hypothetical protein